MWLGVLSGESPGWPGMAVGWVGTMGCVGNSKYFLVVFFCGCHLISTVRWIRHRRLICDECLFVKLKFNPGLASFVIEWKMGCV